MLKNLPMFELFKKKNILILMGMTIFLVVPIFVFAQDQGGLASPAQVGLQGAADLPGQAGLALASTDIRIIVARIIRVALGFLGIVAIVLILYGGYMYMTAAGNEERITTARKILINAVIGLAIILSALAIVQFVIRALTRDVTAPPIPPRAAAPRVGGGALGSGIIESHFPMRGATEVARNTRIVITFKQPIDPGSLANTTAQDAQGQPKYFDEFDDDGDGETDRRTPVPDLTLRTNAIQILRTADISDSVRESDVERYLGSLDEDAPQTDVLVSFTNDLRTFVFTPVERDNHSQRVFFGSATENTGYTVYLCGTATASPNANCAQDGLRLLASGASAFQGYFRDYQWSFEVGTFLDVTPPKIRSVIPGPDATRDGAQVEDRPDQPRNVMLQVNFNEAILPTVASGQTVIASGSSPPPTRGSGIAPGTYDIMRVLAASEFVSGGWEIGNQYRTSEFVSQDLCGRNSCGEDVFCLPEDAAVEVQVRTATLSPAGGPASAGVFDGIEDIAGNALDGNGDGVAQGPGDYSATTFFDRNDAESQGADNARWGFFTTDTILLGSALITATAPQTTLGDPTAGVALNLPLEMQFNRAMAMMTLNSRALNLAGTDAITGGVWDSWWTVEGENFEGDAQNMYGRGLARVLHGGLWEETDYISTATSGVRDLYQNCFYPGAGAGVVTGDTTTTCPATTARPYCCNGQACSPDDPSTESVCNACGF